MGRGGRVRGGGGVEGVRAGPLSLLSEYRKIAFRRYSHYDDQCTVVVLIKYLQKHTFAMSILGGHQLARPLYSGRANPLTSHFCLRGVYKTKRPLITLNEGLGWDLGCQTALYLVL